MGINNLIKSSEKCRTQKNKMNDVQRADLEAVD